MSDMSRNIEGKEAEEILDSILADYELDRTIDKMEDFYDQPNKEVIIDIIEKLLKIIYPGYYRDRAYKSYHANHHLSTLIEDVLYRHIILNGRMTLCIFQFLSASGRQCT